MSYLGCPRIHILGLFYSDPGNLNNLASNYDPNAPLNYDTGLYKYPAGVAQLWLVDCAVTSVVGSDGAICSESSADSLVGATVESPSPLTQKPKPEGGYYDFAKLVDLDPNMQFRSAPYGLRIYVDIPGGGGFSGEWSLPAPIRDIYFMRKSAGIEGNQVAVATWHQRLTGLTWGDPETPSPVYEALKEGSPAGLDVKLAVDMYQTKRANQFTAGDRFGYGRLVASIGPAKEGDPAQLVPGRRLYSGSSFPVTAGAGGLDGPFTREAGEEGLASAEESWTEPIWNKADFTVQALPDGSGVLLVDVGGVAPLEDGGKGRLDLGQESLTFGMYDAGAFTALAHGTFAAGAMLSYRDIGSDAARVKDCLWPVSAGILQIALSAKELEDLKRTPLAVRLGGRTSFVLQENPNGLYINLDTPSTRMEAQTSEALDLYVFQFGTPLSTAPAGLSFQPEVLDAGGNTAPTDIFTVRLGSGDANGCFPLTVSTGPAVPLTDIRKPMDSLLCFVTATGQGYMVDEDNYTPSSGPPPPPILSLLFWQNHRVVAQPTWKDDIQPILVNYARLYPGMKGIMDISDLATIKGFAGAVKGRFQLDVNHPAYMPVVRDMSPATVAMMVSFLDQLSQRLAEDRP